MLSARAVSGLRVALACAASSIVVGHATPAAAYEEKLTLELGLGPALATVDGAAPGGQLVVGVTRGLTSALSLGGDLQLVGLATPAFRAFVHPSVELTALLDVVTVVPRVTVGLGPSVGLTRDPAMALVGHVRLGLDWVRPSALVGFELRLDGALVGSFPDARRLLPSVAVRYVVEFDRY